MPEQMTIVFTTTTGIKATVSYDMVTGIEGQTPITIDDLKDGLILKLFFEQASQHICEMIKAN